MFVHPTGKQILEDEALRDFMRNVVPAGTFGFKGLDIHLFVHPIHVNTRLAQICGLGHTLHILYVYNDESRGIPASDVQELYSDFADFVLYEREENLAIMH